MSDSATGKTPKTLPCLEGFGNECTTTTAVAEVVGITEQARSPFGDKEIEKATAIVCLGQFLR